MAHVCDGTYNAAVKGFGNAEVVTGHEAEAILYFRECNCLARESVNVMTKDNDAVCEVDCVERAYHGANSSSPEFVANNCLAK